MTWDFALLIGLVLVLTHNVWVWDWMVIITVLGWAALIKGAVILLLPKSMEYFQGWFKTKTLLMIASLVAIILGVVLGYFGFFA